MTKKRRVRSVVNFFGWCAAFVAILLGAALVAGLKIYRGYEERAAKFDLAAIDNLPQRSEVFDANGELYSYFGSENRVVVPLSSVSKHFLNALIAREDARFWEHSGIDYYGVLRAFVANLRAGETKQGGSTITQQLARNACALHARTLDRKALEAVLARHIERSYTKEQILELYVNRIYFGSGCYGIEAAARRYFGKAAADLSLSEGATLAAMIRSPRRLDPTRDLAAAIGARDEVLARMVEVELATPAEVAAAKAQQLRLTSRDKYRVTDDDVMDAVLREMEGILDEDTLEYGGLRVFMTIDPAIQRLAQDAADRKLSEIEEKKGFPHPSKKDFEPGLTDDGKEKPTDYLQAAVVVVENRTGAIRAVVGGRDYHDSKYSRAMLSHRQVGSTFKPFVYATAFERGMLPGTLVDDSQIQPGEFHDIPKKWSPANSDGDYQGLQPAAVGLLKSRNTMSVRVGEFAGLGKVRQVAQALGLSDTIPPYPVVFLGGFETTPRQLAAAYTVFPNLGVFRPSYLISSVEDREGRILWQAPRDEKRVLSPNSAWMVSGILQQVMKSGTAAKSASLGWKKIGAGKTGTTNDFFDAWFVGYTTSLTCAVWVGMDQPKTIMARGYGATLALPIWVEVMQHVPEKTYPAAPFQAPERSLRVKLCSVSGARATAGCISQGTAYDADLPASRIPRDTCRTHPDLPVPPQPAVMPYVSAPARAPALPPIAEAPAPAAQAAVGASASELAPMTRITPRDPRLQRMAQPPYPTSPEPIGERTDEMLRVDNTQGRGRITHWPSARRDLDEPFPGVEAAPDERPPAPSRPARQTVEVRRAVPVSPLGRGEYLGSGEIAPGVTEERTLQRLPDGRLRTVIVRRVRPQASISE